MEIVEDLGLKKLPENWVKMGKYNLLRRRGIFFCPVCKRNVEKDYNNGKYAKYCSRECYFEDYKTKKKKPPTNNRGFMFLRYKRPAEGYKETNFRKWLVDFMTERDLSCVKFAQLMGLHKNTITLYARGIRTPSYEILLKIKSALDDDWCEFDTNVFF